MNQPPIDLWGISARLIPLAGGHRNQVLRTRGLTADLVFKTTRRTNAAIEWLHPVLVLAERSGLIVPRPIGSANSRYVEQGWTCEPFIDGETCGREDMSRIERPLHLFHEATADVPQRPGFRAARDLVAEVRGGDVDLRGMPGDIAAFCRDAWSRVAARPLCVVHGDLNPANLLLTQGGRVALLDWDECRVDAALFDNHQLRPAASGAAAQMAAIAWEIACCWHLEPDYAKRLARAAMPMASPGT